jgi:NarL family two-component system response regulator LiaR
MQSLSATGFQQNEGQSRMLFVGQHSRSCCQVSCPLKTLDGFDLVGEARTCREALRLCYQVQPDVLLMDFRARWVDGVSLLPLIHKRWPHLRLVVLASFPLELALQRLREMGVVLCLVESDPTRKLAERLRAFSQNQLSSRSADGSGPSLRPCSGQALSPRERQVWGWMLQGQSSLEIAQRLGVNELTARFHVQNVLSKLCPASLLEESPSSPSLAEPLRRPRGRSQQATGTTEFHPGLSRAGRFERH